MNCQISYNGTVLLSGLRELQKLIKNQMTYGFHGFITQYDIDFQHVPLQRVHNKIHSFHSYSKSFRDFGGPTSQKRPKNEFHSYAKTWQQDPECKEASPPPEDAHQPDSGVDKSSPTWQKQPCCTDPSEVNTKFTQV